MPFTNWLTGRRRKRQADTTNYSELFLSLLNANANAQTSSANATAAMEIAAGLYARALASAELLPGGDPRTRAVNAEIRAHIGRDLMLYGESIYLIDTTGGRVRLVRASAADIHDTANGGLRYRLDIASATRHRSVWADGRAVLHFKINESPKDPTRGLSPFVVAGNTARLCGGVERLLGNEILGASGYIIPIPKAGRRPGQ